MGPAPAIAVERLEDHVAHLVAEAADLGGIAGDEGGRHQVGEFGDEDLFRRIAHPGRIVDDERLRMDALEQVRRGDVGHVEGRVLAQQHHVHGGQIDTLGRAERVVIALDVAQLHRLDGGVDLAVAQAQAVRRVVEEPVAAALRLETHGEGGIARDVDGRHMVHLDRDVLDLCHGKSPQECPTHLGCGRRDGNGPRTGSG